MTPSNRPPRPDAGEGAVELAASSEAVAALREALHGQPPGTGLRIWVETGIRPQVKMMLDRPTDRDLRTEVEGIPVWIDSLSLRFVRGARVEYVTEGGQHGFRVVGPNVPGSSAGAEPPRGASPEGTPAPPAGRAAVEEKVRAALKQIFDPEIPMNLVDLGLIYGLDWSSDRSLTIRMTLTSVGCPATEAIREEVERTARQASGLDEVRVDIVWDPPWSPDRMSLFAKRQFGYV